MAANGDEPCARRADDVEFETLGLLDGLDSAARRERAELIAWLIEEGFSLEHIRASVAAPLMLPAYRVLGDDGQLVSARDICELTGMNLEVVQRLHRAVGLPRIDDPDARVLPRADAESIRHAKLFLDLGYAPQDAVAVEPRPARRNKGTVGRRRGVRRAAGSGWHGGQAGGRRGRVRRGGPRTRRRCPGNHGRQGRGG